MKRENKQKQLERRRLQAGRWLLTGVKQAEVARRTGAAKSTVHAVTKRRFSGAEEYRPTRPAGGAGGNAAPRAIKARRRGPWVCHRAKAANWLCLGHTQGFRRTHQGYSPTAPSPKRGSLNPYRPMPGACSRDPSPTPPIVPRSTQDNAECRAYAQLLPRPVPRAIANLLGWFAYGFSLQTEDESDERNCVRAENEETPYPKLDCDPARLPAAVAEHRKLIRAFRLALLRAGYVNFAKRIGLAGTAHACGTLVTGKDPERSVVDQSGRDGQPLGGRRQRAAPYQPGQPVFKHLCLGPAGGASARAGEEPYLDLIIFASDARAARSDQPKVSAGPSGDKGSSIHRGRTPRSAPGRRYRHSTAPGQNFKFLKIPSGIARTMAMTAHHLAL